MFMSLEATVLHTQAIQGSSTIFKEAVRVITWIKAEKSKAVPLHATLVLGGRRGIAPTHFRPRH
jgi:hypothetical protein